MKITVNPSALDWKGFSGESYNREVSALTAQLCASVYGEGGEFERAVLEGGFKRGRIYGFGSATVGIAEHHEVIFVCCRGSNDVIDWRHNFQFLRVRDHAFDMTRVARGFLKHAIQTNGQIGLEVRAALERSPRAKVIYTGHSLGSTLAALLACESVTAFRITPSAVYLHAMPRLGGAPFESWYEDGPLGRVTHRTAVIKDGVQDLVTRVPPTVKPFSARHIGKPQIYYLTDGKVQRFEGQGDWRRAKQLYRVSRLRALTRFFRSVAAHPIENTVRATLLDFPCG